jgi:two-component system response regulator NreC
MEVVGEAGDGRRALQLVRELVPNIVVMDVQMPDMNGIEAVRRLHAEFPRVKVIALSMHADRRSIKNMLRAGASMYLLKECTCEELAQTIRLAMSNRVYLSPGLTDLILKDYVSYDLVRADRSAFSVLRAREREVLRLVSEGKRSAQIAEMLHISIRTVETHRQNIMQKLNIRNVAQLTKYALREGLTSLEDVSSSRTVHI